MRQFITCLHCGTQLLAPSNPTEENTPNSGQALPSIVCEGCGRSVSTEWSIPEGDGTKTANVETPIPMDVMDDQWVVEDDSIADEFQELTSDSTQTHDVEQPAHDGGPVIVFSVDDEAGPLHLESLAEVDTAPPDASDDPEQEIELELDDEVLAEVREELEDSIVLERGLGKQEESVEGAPEGLPAAANIVEEPESATLDGLHPAAAIGDGQGESEPLELELEADTDEESQPLDAFLRSDGESEEQFDAQEVETLEAEQKQEVEEETLFDESQLQAIGAAAAVPRRRVEVSPLRKLLPPVLGGLAAFPIATAIMWYGFGRDLGTTGQFVSQYVPWIVPAKLHKRSWETANETSNIKRLPPPSSPRSGSSNLPKLNRGNDSSDNSAVSTADAKKDQDKRASKLEPLGPSNLPNAPQGTLSDSRKQLEPKPPVMDDQVSNAELPEESLLTVVSELRDIQAHWNQTPKDKQIATLTKYLDLSKSLSLLAKSKLGSSPEWQSQFKTIAAEILSNKQSKKILQVCPGGQRAGISAVEPGDFVTAYIEFEKFKDVDENSMVARPAITWKYKDLELPVELQSDAWPSAAIGEALSCLVLGRLVKSDQEPGLALRVHQIFLQAR